MKRYLSSLFAALVVVGAVAAAQDKPNFAGTWKLSDPATPDQFTPSVMTVAQDATNLTVTTVSQMGSSRRHTRSMAPKRGVPSTSMGRRSIAW